MSDEPTTKELPAADPIAVLTKTLVDGLRNIDNRLDSQDTKLDKVVTEGIEANVRLTRIEVRVDSAEARVGDLEGRIGRTSTRVHEDSEHDMARDAKLAEVIVWRKGVDDRLGAMATKEDISKVTESQTAAIMAGFDTVRKSPLVKMVVTALIAALSTYAATKGISIR